MMRVFSNDEAIAILYTLRFSGIPCAICGRSNTHKRRRHTPGYRCGCRDVRHPMSGTIMQGSHNPGQWFTVMWLLTQESEMSLRDIKRKLGRQSATVNIMHRKIVKKLNEDL